MIRGYRIWNEKTKVRDLERWGQTSVKIGRGDTCTHAYGHIDCKRRGFNTTTYIIYNLLFFTPLLRINSHHVCATAGQLQALFSVLCAALCQVEQKLADTAGLDKVIRSIRVRCRSICWNSGSNAIVDSTVCIDSLSHSPLFIPILFKHLDLTYNNYC